MTFVEAVAVLRRHKLLVVYGVLVALLLATFSTYRLDGTEVGQPERAGVRVQGGRRRASGRRAADDDGGHGDDARRHGPGDRRRRRRRRRRSAVTTTTTTVRAPPLAPLPAVVDSRAMYYTALSLKTIVVSPGFAEAVKDRAPDDGRLGHRRRRPGHQHDGCRRRRLDPGRSPTTTMAAALAELQSVVATYSSTPATRFSLDGVVISAPSAPSATSSIKGPLTFVIVVVVVLALWWFLIRGVDDVRRASRRSKRAAAERRAAAAHRVGVSSDEAAATTNGARPIHVASPQPGGAAGTPSAAGNGQRPEPAAPVR